MLQHNDSDFPSQWARSAPSIVSYAELRMDDISSVRELLAELNNGGCGQATDLRSVRNISTCTALPRKFCSNTGDASHSMLVNFRLVVLWLLSSDVTQMHKCHLLLQFQCLASASSRDIMFVNSVCVGISMGVLRV